MGSSHGTTHERTPEPIQTINVEPTICSLCLDRNQRVRQSVCTCNHCSLPLCSDCMGEHIDELPKNIAQLTHQLHELEKIFQSKQNMVQEEISKSTAEIKQCFKTYQNDLLEAHQAIIVGVEKAKQDAKVINQSIKLFFNIIFSRNI